MEGLSERAYAAHAGLSRGAVQKARKTGRLVLFADGSINAAASDARRAATTDPDQQRRSLGGAKAGAGMARTRHGQHDPEDGDTDPPARGPRSQNAARASSSDSATSSLGATAPGSPISGPGDSTSYLKARTALTVYQAQERQLAIQKKRGVLVDRARAETLVFRLARQERDVWVTWPARVAALMAATLSAEMEKHTGAPVTIETAILQRVLETHVREQLDGLAELRVNLS